MWVVFIWYFTNNAQFLCLHPIRRVHQRCSLDMCCFKPFVDLDFFPQMLHGCDIPVIWTESMCSLMFSFLSSFPQTLQIIALFLFLLYCIMFSPGSIMELITWKCWDQDAQVGHWVLGFFGIWVRATLKGGEGRKMNQRLFGKVQCSSFEHAPLTLKGH